MSYLCKLSDVLWNPCLLILFTVVGGYYTLRSGFFQLRLLTWLRGTVGTLGRGKKRQPQGLSQVQALCTALASTIGTGSIAGVATAIFLGGPGAVLWMWVSAFLGMMTGFGEKALAVRWRHHGPSGYFGGPMAYMEQGLCKPLGGVLATLFSLFVIPASLAGGALVQSNSIAASVNAAFGLPRGAVGLVTAAAAGAVIFGGIGRVGKLSQRLVPIMAGLFLTAGVVCLVAQHEALPGALRAIWDGALRPQAAFGGYCAAVSGSAALRMRRAPCGYSAGLALRYGVARGVFTNEAGLGSSAIAHAAADAQSPGQEGLWGMVEVFFATLVVCTVTALVILTSGVYAPDQALAAIRAGAVDEGMLGAPLSARAFGATLGGLGPVIVAICLLLFAFTSLLGWSYYGERGLCHLTRSEKFTPAFRWAFLACAALGAVGDVTMVWQLADLFNALMALPNLTALLLLSPEVLRLLPSGKRGASPAG